MPWHPPIPAEAVYRDEVASLGAGLRLLLYCYNCVARDGTLTLSLAQASDGLKVQYETLRNWWQALKATGIVTVIGDHGKRGIELRINDDWLDWHVLAQNYPASTVRQRSNMTAEEPEMPDPKAVNGQIRPLKQGERSVNGPSTVRQRSNMTAEASAYKEDQHDQESESSRRDSRAPPSAHQQLMQLYVGRLGYKLTTGPQEAAAAKKILAAGYTPEQAIEAYETLKSDQFWQAKHLSLQTVYKQMGAILQAPKGQANGTAHRNSGRKQQYTPPTPEWSGWTPADLDKPL